MLEYINQLLQQINPAMAYFVLFLSAIIENIFPPIPGDTVTVIGAYLITQGNLGFWGVYLSTSTGSLVGFFLMYFFGLKFGRSFVRSRFKAKIFNEEMFNRVEKWFVKYGYWVILANRFLSGTRSVIALFAGFFHLDWYKVILLGMISALVWNGLLIYGGYLLGVNWEMITSIIGRYNKIVLVLTLIVVVIFIVVKKYRKKKSV
ncbi:MAG: DedA family protein [Calditrichaceae bacterium]|nr:DedA family protein [Calditrichaceae bacterium]HES58800.1 DedA family protein [Caldithrix sp.]